MRSMYQVLSKQKRLQVASEGGTVEIRVSQFIRQCIPSCRRSHGKGTTTTRAQLEPWGDEQATAGRTETPSLSDPSDRHAQPRQAVGRPAAKTTPAYHGRLYNAIIQTSMPHTIQQSPHVTRSAKEPCQTAAAPPRAAHNSRRSTHDALQLVDDSPG